VGEAERAWAAARDTTSIAVLEAFRRQYGAANPFYDKLAEARIDELRRQKVAVAAPPPQTRPPPVPLVKPAVGLIGPSRGEPIRIGFGMSLTGGLAANGKSALLAMKIWEEDVNGRGGLIGRPVRLVYYDDQSNPSMVPGLYAKLMDVDRVDLIVGGYGTNMIAPAMPLAMQRRKLLTGLFAFGGNAGFNYDRYFSMAPLGPDPKSAITRPFFDVALRQSPRPRTVALAAADAEFARNACEGARSNARAAGLQIVYDKAYPPGTVDFRPVLRAIQATSPDIAVFCSYPVDSVGLVRAMGETSFRARIVGGAMALQTTAVKAQLGPLLNGITNYELWLPAGTLEAPGLQQFLAKYQARAGAEGVDPLGYYLGTWGYAYAQLIEQAVKSANSLDDNKLAEYFRANTFKTIMGDVKFGAKGEWAESRFVAVQYHGIKSDALDQFRGMETQTIIGPPRFKTGDVIYPYEKAK
jgi:branched-chain amino acid transport system substrate-binding protein